MYCKCRGCKTGLPQLWWGHQAFSCRKCTACSTQDSRCPLPTKTSLFHSHTLPRPEHPTLQQEKELATLTKTAFSKKNLISSQSSPNSEFPACCRNYKWFFARYQQQKAQTNHKFQSAIAQLTLIFFLFCQSLGSDNFNSGHNERRIYAKPWRLWTFFFQCSANTKTVPWLSPLCPISHISGRWQCCECRRVWLKAFWKKKPHTKCGLRNKRLNLHVYMFCFSVGLVTICLKDAIEANTMQMTMADTPYFSTWTTTEQSRTPRKEQVGRFDNSWEMKQPQQEKTAWVTLEAPKYCKEGSFKMSLFPLVWFQLHQAFWPT